MVNLFLSMADCSENVDLSGLYREYNSRLYKLALGFAGNEDQAEDLLSDTWLRFARYFKSHPHSNGSLTNYFFRIMHNVWFDRLRKNYLSRALSLDEKLEDSFSRESANLPLIEYALAVRDDESALEIEERNEQVHRILGSLPDKYSCLLVSRYWLGKVQEDDLNGLSSRTVRWRLHRACRLFKQAYLRLGDSSDTF